jgi:flagellar biosynthesis/type III secretory pathway M-ring protein FliF/YscJ
VTQVIKSLSGRKEELDKKEKKTKKEEEELKEILMEMNKNIDEIENIQSLSYRVFDNTAEIYTRNKLINWWLVHLLYEEIDGKTVPFFGDGNEDDKFKKYDELEEQEEESFSDFFESLIKRVVSLVVFWYMSEETPDQQTFEIIDPALEKKKEGEKEDEKEEEETKNNKKDEGNEQKNSES